MNFCKSASVSLSILFVGLIPQFHLVPNLYANEMGYMAVEEASSLKEYPVTCTTAWLDCEVAFSDKIMLIKVLQPSQLDIRKNGYDRIYRGVGRHRRGEGSFVLPFGINNIKRLKAGSCTPDMVWDIISRQVVGDCTGVEGHLSIYPARGSTIPMHPEGRPEIWERVWDIPFFLKKENSDFADAFMAWMEAQAAERQESVDSAPGF